MLKSRSLEFADMVEDPRVRMKEVRTLVKQAHKEGRRVDLMNFAGADIPRAMIALQDMLAKEQERHKKATKLLARAVADDRTYAFVMEHATITLLANQETIGDLSRSLKQEREDHLQTQTDLSKALTTAMDLHDEIQAIQRMGTIYNGFNHG